MGFRAVWCRGSRYRVLGFVLKHPHRTAFGFRALGVVGLQRLRFSAGVLGFGTFGWVAGFYGSMLGFWNACFADWGLGIEDKRLWSLDSEARAMVKIGGRDRGSSEARAGRLNISSQDIEALCSKPYT